MKKRIAGLVLLCFAICFLTAAENVFEREAVLTESTVQSFISNHAALFADIKASKEDKWLNLNTRSSPRETLDTLSTVEPPRKIRMLFKQYGLDSEMGHLQIAVMQYGIIALEIEEALTEVSAMNRTKRELAADKKVAAYLNELKAQLNSKDFTLIRTHRQALRPIFNTDD